MKKPTTLSLAKLLLANPWGFIVPVMTGVVSSVAGVALLGVSGWFISAAGLATALGTALAFNYLTPGAIVRGLAILRTAGRYGEQVTAHNHLLGLLRTLRLWVWDQRVAKPIADLHQQSRGDLLQRLVSDLDQIIRWPLVVFLPWLYALLGYIGVSIFAYFIDPVLLWPLTIAALCHLVILPYVCGRFASHAVHVGQILGVHRRSRFVSLFSALITLTIRGHWQDYAARLEQLDCRQKRMEWQIQQAISLGRLLGYLVTIGLFASLFFLLGDLQADTFQTSAFQNDSMNWQLKEHVSGTWLVGLVLALLAVNELVLPLVQSFVAQGQSQVGLRRLNQIQQDAPSVSAPALGKLNRLSLQDWRGYHLESGLGNQPIHLELSAGDTLWLRGASGTGKSTLLASIAGDCLATGKAYVNQEECKIYDNPNFQAQLSYLPQSPYVFQQSIAANLMLGKADASDTEMWAVLEAVALADWAKGLENGLSTLLSSQGRDLSGGQRKRLALARLLLRRAPLLLLDEPFDGLDKATIERICQALEHDYQPDMLILVSHIDSPLSGKAKVIELPN
ncbi:amino acid ABC transporter ATP-binding/permease protein [Marinomonas sp. TW1]|uniref:amino acid ABC transporter ATP-binding/permease protein n=1 Tax=Marinomonas sp. TW1 TaxID=1561203 RepID=UPI0007AFB16E|nr:ATP-binding cassette domain-containing protein [Marinomonas sp. TW1]KZN13598.1 ABC transporter [Marinomonas sp. TW1]